ncbi:MAG: hypothetical protein CMG74_10460 [Candidatus Marinimicrobia bacterium]|nr:hypothetical protein [Candidatus Neomarinimicrobiota bacterium]|tara:strand:- start:16656 stop:17297 length:642 start_codon:yes stop_codon:yes gene_type:complete
MDKKYWNKYYKNHGKDVELISASSFAQFCIKRFLKDKKTILELGSGNGRDAFYFLTKGHKVIALDQSHIGLEVDYKLDKFESIRSNIILKSCDFVKEDFSQFGSIDVFYSRFTLHAINNDDEKTLISKIYDSMNKNGMLLIEARTINDPLFGKGNQVGKNEFVTDHYRRFINSNKFISKALSIGFKLKYFNEQNGLSIYKDDDPVLMRVLLEK